MAVEIEGRAQRLSAAADVRSTLEQLRAAAQTAASAADPGQAMNAARVALKQSQAFGTASLAASNLRKDATRVVEAKPTTKEIKTAPSEAAAQTPARAATAAPATAASDGDATPGQLSQIQSIVSEGRGMAKDVIRMAGNKPGSGDFNFSPNPAPKFAECGGSLNGCPRFGGLS